MAANAKPRNNGGYSIHQAHGNALIVCGSGDACYMLAFLSTAQLALALAVLIGILLGYFVSGMNRKKGAVTATTGIVCQQSISLAPSRLELGAANSPTISIRPLQKLPAERLSPIALDSEALSRLSPVLQQAPSLAATFAVAAGNFYELTFSPDVMKGLSDGSLALRKSLEGGFRAMAENGTGQIVEHGSLDPLEALKTAAAATAIWQILSIAVAQKHLADINTKLKAIASGIRGIRDWLLHERQGKLEGNLQYLTTVADCFLEGRLTEQGLATYYGRFEDIERETIQIVRSVELGLEQLQSRIPTIEMKEWFGTKHDTESIRTEIQEYERLSKAWVLAMHVRAAACQLSCALPGEQPVAEHRLFEIQDALTRSDVRKASVPLFEDMIRNRLDSLWNFNSTLTERREKLSSQLSSVENWAVDSEQQISQTLRRIGEAIESERLELSQPMRIVAEVNSDGEVIGVSRVMPAFLDQPRPVQ